MFEELLSQLGAESYRCYFAGSGFPFLGKTDVLLFFPLSSPVLTLARCSEFLTRETKNSGLEETLDSISWETRVEA